MGDCVEPGLDEDEDPGELVEVDVMVEWQFRRQPHFPHQGDGVTEDEGEYHHWVEIDAHPCFVIEWTQCEQLCRTS